MASPRRGAGLRTAGDRAVSHDPTSALPAPAETPAPRSNFIREMVADDVASGRFGRPVCTRFPPEPNGFLHIGHSKSLVLNFGLARDFGGRVHLRFDDTNPFTEDIKYVNAIKDDIRWLGFEWDAEFYARHPLDDQAARA